MLVAALGALLAFPAFAQDEPAPASTPASQSADVTAPPAAPAAGAEATQPATATSEPVIANSPYPVCAGCHNGDGNSVISANPKLAALDPKYILKQLQDFKSGERTSPIMGTMVGQISESEFEAVADYFGAKARSPGAAADAALAEKGREIYDEGILETAAPACSGCHNDDGSGTNKFPRLAGQHADYVFTQLMNFKNGVRKNDSRGVMQAVARRMSEEQMHAVAQYIAGLAGLGGE